MDEWVVATWGISADLPLGLVIPEDAMVHGHFFPRRPHQNQSDLPLDVLYAPS
jgi:hypothetical protein